LENGELNGNGQTARVSAQWVLALGVLLVISVLCNVLLFFQS